MAPPPCPIPPCGSRSRLIHAPHPGSHSVVFASSGARRRRHGGRGGGGGRGGRGGRGAQVPRGLTRELSAPSRPRQPLLVFDDALNDAYSELQGEFQRADRAALAHSRRVHAAMTKHRVTRDHFSGSTGYGHDNFGQEVLDAVFADIFGTQAAACRPQFMSGTHALACVLFGLLRPGDTLVSAAGAPYDTMMQVIGNAPTAANSTMDGDEGRVAGRPYLDGSLMDCGALYDEVPLSEQGRVQPAVLTDVVKRTLEDSPEGRVLVLVQRSCGYTDRPCLSPTEVEQLIDAARVAAPEGQHDRVRVMVDNCYCEFVGDAEYSFHHKAEAIAGSLIKNPGGGIAPRGGYVAGTPAAVGASLRRLAAPGVTGSAVDGETMRLIFQGLWLAPGSVAESVKGGMLLAYLAERMLGVTASPGAAFDGRHDVVTRLSFGERERMLRFVQAIQTDASPIDAHVLPTSEATDGYHDEVIFAAGTFIEGSTSELTADGPMRDPYVAYCQGGTHVTQWALAMERVLLRMDQE